MKLFCAQVKSVWEDPWATLEKVEPCIARASRGGGDLICFPEQFATGWDPESALHVQGIDGPVTGRLRLLAEEYSIAILGSFREETGRTPRNTCVVVSSDGEIVSTYSKCHLFSPASENLHYTRGDAIATFSIGGVECGLAICYDLRFTSLFRLYADAGVHAVLVPAAWPEARLQHWELFIRARALEYQVYVAGINTTGITPVDLYGGGSMVTDPTGGLLVRAGQDEALISCELDREYVERVRAALPVARDRRDDLAPSPERKQRGPAKNR